MPTLHPILEMSYSGLVPLLDDWGVATRDETNALKIALVGYSSEEGLLGCLATICYRIWNAFKAIFDQSDWQIARRALKEIIVRASDNPVLGPAMLNFCNHNADLQKQEENRAAMEHTQKCHVSDEEIDHLLDSAVQGYDELSDAMRQIPANAITAITGVIDTLFSSIINLEGLDQPSGMERIVGLMAAGAALSQDEQNPLANEQNPLAVVRRLFPLFEQFGFIRANVTADNVNARIIIPVLSVVLNR